MPQFQARLDPSSDMFLQVQLLQAALFEAVKFNELIKSDTREVSQQEQTAMKLSFARLFVLFERAGGNITPKFHLMRHSINQAAVYGAPKYFATYVDESFNGVIASIARNCHKLTWAETLFSRLSAIEQIDRNRLAGFRHV